MRENVNIQYIGGTHPAAAGGAWKPLVQGFEGLSIKEGMPQLFPCLPAHWEALRFRFIYKNTLYEACAKQAGWQIDRVNIQEGEKSL